MIGQITRSAVEPRPAVLAPSRYAERAARARRVRRDRRSRMTWLGAALLVPCLWVALSTGESGRMLASPAAADSERVTDPQTRAMTPDEDLIYWQNLVAEAAQPGPSDQ